MTAKIVDAGELARIAGVSRKTILRAARRKAALVGVGNKWYVSADSVGAVLGKRHDPSVASIGVADAENPKTLQEVATELKCGRSTVVRVLERTGLGIEIGGRKYVPGSQIPDVKANVLSNGITRTHLDPEKMRNHAKRMAEASARVRKQAAKIRRSGMAPPTR